MILYSIIFGAIQALTEFLPVSSSGHLIILHDILNFDLGQNLAFDIALHLGTGFALLFCFWGVLIKYLKAFGQFLIQDKKLVKQDLDIFFKIIVASIPAGIIGVLLDSYFEEKLRNLWIVAISLILVGVLFIIIEKKKNLSQSYSSLSFGQALLIGFAQSIALIPGVSRSGITMVASMWQGLKREEAAAFSFLISLPVILGAGLLKFVKMDLSAFTAVTFSSFVIGFLVSWLLGMVVIKVLLKYLQNNRLNIFAYYRFGLAIIVIIYLIVKG